MSSRQSDLSRRSEIQIRYGIERFEENAGGSIFSRDNEEKPSLPPLYLEKFPQTRAGRTILALFASWRVYTHTHTEIYIYIVGSPRGTKPTLQPELASRIAVPFNRIKVNATSSPRPSLSLLQSSFYPPCLQIEHLIKSALSDLIPQPARIGIVEILLLTTTTTTTTVPRIRSIKPIDSSRNRPMIRL